VGSQQLGESTKKAYVRVPEEYSNKAPFESNGIEISVAHGCDRHNCSPKSSLRGLDVWLLSRLKLQHCMLEKMTRRTARRLTARGVFLERCRSTAQARRLAARRTRDMRTMHARRPQHAASNIGIAAGPAIPKWTHSASG
jgi:hypothetical protein